MDCCRAIGSNSSMHRLTAIVVIVSILAASAGEFAHACTMGEQAPPAVSAAVMPCHGDDGQSDGHAAHRTDDPAMESMDCCGDAGAPTCFDCLCTAVSMPLSALETAIPQSLPASLRHALPLSAGPPPERPPEYLLRPPINVS